MIEKLVQQDRQAISRPRPTTFAAPLALDEAFLVDVNDNNTGIDGSLSGQSNARVVEDGVKPIH